MNRLGSDSDSGIPAMKIHGLWVALMLAMSLVIGTTACRGPQTEPDPQPDTNRDTPETGTQTEDQEPTEDTVEPTGIVVDPNDGSETDSDRAQEILSLVPPTDLPVVPVVEDGLEGVYVPTIHHRQSAPYALYIYRYRDSLNWFLLGDPLTRKRALGQGTLRVLDRLEALEFSQTDPESNRPRAIESFPMLRSANRWTLLEASNHTGERTAVGEVMGELVPQGQIHWVRVSGPVLDSNETPRLTAPVLGAFHPMTRRTNGGRLLAADSTRRLVVWPDGHWTLTVTSPESGAVQEVMGRWFVAETADEPVPAMDGRPSDRLVFVQITPGLRDATDTDAGTANSGEPGVSNRPIVDGDTGSARDTGSGDPMELLAGEPEAPVGRATYRFVYDVDRKVLWLTLEESAGEIPAFGPQTVGATTVFLGQRFGN